MLVLKGLEGLHRTVQLQLLQNYWLGTWITVILNGLPWKLTEIIFETTCKYCISDSFVDHDGYSISSRDSCPQ